MDEPRTVDARWIESVVREHEGRLCLFATRLLGDAERARDVVQDTFLKLWQVDRAKVEGHLAAWLYTVCRHGALDVRRKERRMTRLGESPAEVPVAADDGERGREPETAHGVLALVASLPPRQQEAVRLKFQGGLSYREVAEVMDTTVNNVGVLLHTAIKTIRGELAGTGATPSTTPGATG